MAYIVSKSSQSFTASASISTVLQAHATNDLLLVCLSQDGGGTTISTASSGWAMLGTQAASGASRQAWAYKVAASGAEADPTFSGATDEWIATVLVIRDADATNPFGATPTSGTDFVRTDWSAVNTSNSGSLTTAVDNCLLLYSWCADGNGVQMRTLATDTVCVDKLAPGLTYPINHIIGSRQIGTAGAAPTVAMYTTLATEGGNGWVLAVRNKTNGNLALDCRAGFTDLNWYGDFGGQHQAVTWAAPDTFAANVDGVSVSSTSPTTSINTSATLATWGLWTGLASTQSTAGHWVGGYHAITSTDMSNKIFGIEWWSGNVSAARGGAKGHAVGFKDGSGNWVVYTLSIKDDFLAVAVLYNNQIDLGGATVLDSSGTMDWTDVVGIAYLTHRVGSSASSDTWYIRNATLSAPAVLTGGGETDSVDTAFLNTGLLGWGYVGNAASNQSALCCLQGSAQMLGKMDVQIGDGSIKTYFDASASSFEYPSSYTSSGVQRYWNVPVSNVNLTIKASASDTINMAAGVIATATKQSFTIDATSSTSATYSFNGTSFVGWDVTWKTGVPCTGATFKSGGEIDAKGATFTNCTISTTTSTDAAIAFTASGGTLDSSTIDVTGTSAAYHLEVGNGGTGAFSITLTDVTFTGTPATDKVHVTNTSGTTTININGTTTLVAGDVTSDGATVSIVSSPVYQSVVVSGFTAGSRIQIYDTTNTVELFNGTASAGDTVVSGSTATWTDPIAAAGNRAIRVRVAYVSGATAKDFLELTGLTAGTTSGTAGITYPVTQVNDTTYINNGIDGSTVTGVTFTDASPDLVNIDVASNAITWPSIYAAWVYYAFGATGIATDIDYIDGIDTANYLLSNMKIKNTSSPSEPLVVSGGYGRDATTGASLDLVDTTGGTLIFAPDHVVSYAVGSGVTSQDKTDIATAVLSAASAAPIASNIKQVNSLTVDGTGTDSDPWGPV
jgi:hypothetical protein